LDIKKGLKDHPILKPAILASHMIAATTRITSTTASIGFGSMGIKYVMISQKQKIAITSQIKKLIIRGLK